MLVTLPVSEFDLPTVELFDWLSAGFPMVFVKQAGNIKSTAQVSMPALNCDRLSFDFSRIEFNP